MSARRTLMFFATVGLIAPVLVHAQPMPPGAPPGRAAGGTTMFARSTETPQSLLAAGAAIASANDAMLFLKNRDGTKWYACTMNISMGMLAGQDPPGGTVSSTCWALN